MILVGAAILAAPPLLQEAYSDSPCPTGTELVTNTGACVTGPSGNIARNKGGKLMDTSVCTTYPGRETDEVNWHKNKVTTLGAAATASYNTSQDTNVGDIAVIVDDGSIVFTDGAGTRVDLVDATKKFMATHQDVYDYIFWWPNFNHAEGSFHIWVQTNTQGINAPVQNSSATYGTQFLKSLVIYRNYLNFPSDPRARILPNNDSTLSLMGQESGHRFAAWVRRDKDPGPRIRATTDLLGRNLAHWCFYMNVPSRPTDPNRAISGFSSMEGNYWFENTPGFRTTIMQSDGYAPLDQYLMGFRSPGTVGTFFRLDPGGGNVNPDCAHQPFTPGVDTPWTFSYPKINVVMDDIIRVEGARVPDAQTSQKNYRVAFALLAKQGTFPTSADITKLNTYRAAWETYYRDETGGGKMFTALGLVDMDGDTYFSNVDCDEQDPAVHPGVAEVCNAVDDDCDGLIDEDFDLDGDLYTTCNGDCNDGNAAVNPGATEVWNTLDDNCDGAIDNVNLIDADGDGYYTNPQPPAAADCNDGNAAVNPGATEIVNGLDDNCNGYVDCADTTVVKQSDSGSRGHDGFDNDCNGIIDG
jgi:hypothetical protein